MAVSSSVQSALHPALVVAKGLGFGGTALPSLQILEETEKSAVYRLRLDVRGRESIVVKRCPPGLGKAERAMYEIVLPQLPVATLRYFGSYEDGEGALWFALEDAGDAEPSLETSQWRALLTEWIATLHLEGARVAESALPDRGPGHFERRLHDARTQLIERLDRKEPDARKRKILKRTVERCDELVACWPCLAAVCSRFPRTVVHGDLVEENLRLTGSAEHPWLLALDWEKAGWGVPAVDVVATDSDRYWELTRGWLGSSRAALRELLLVGRIFRVLDRHWPAKSITKVKLAESRLSRLLSEGGWTNGC